jgi:peptidoglycan/LPS O-acetylase OafA/YrhL
MKPDKSTLGGAVYRKDIDGLRCLAVMPVVLFHANIRGFTGGYVGVDIFFVISGYLISGILFRELKAGHFSIYEFYRRRVLRIFPALFVMMAVVSAVSVWFLLPSELIKYAESVLATTGFVSNIYYYLTAGYFASEAASAPLLHTWSLAVEEQFYLFWPLLLMLIYKTTHHKLLGGVMVLLIASFIASLIWLDKDATGAFYLIPSRAWELLIGALVALMPPLNLRYHWLAQGLSLIGVGLILICIRAYSYLTPFPGLNALWPCLGAALIIYAGAGHETIVSKALGLKPIVFIGQISFSLYLWHWPVIVFADLGLMLKASLWLQVCEIGLSIVLAYLSWRFVELPFRQPWARKAPVAGILVPGMGLMGVFAASAVFGLTQKGFPERLPKPLQAIAAYADYDGDHLYRGGTCFVVDPKDIYQADSCLKMRAGARHVLLLGDSLSAHLWPGLSQVAPEMDILQANQVGCRPVLLEKPSRTVACETLFRHMLTQWLPKSQVDTVILSGRWFDEDMVSLAPTLKAISPNTHVILIGPVPQYSSALPRILVRAAITQDKGLASRSLLPEPFALDKRMRAISADFKNVTYVSMIDYLCKQKDCRSYAQGQVPLQFDSRHFTLEGSIVAANRIKPEIEAGLENTLKP